MLTQPYTLRPTLITIICSNDDAIIYHHQEQYIFIHDAILESVTCGDTQIDAGHLRASLDNLIKKNQFEMSELEIQFAVRLSVN